MFLSKRYSKAIATFFLVILFPSLLPVNLLYASNNGPESPEAKSFEPVNATDMVNLSSGDLSYVLPLMDVGGMPITMSYHGGIPLDLESTWTGLGWNLNTGAINRSLNATPDDWKGGNALDFIHYEKSETYYTANLGVGIGKAAEVGIGASWGSNKSLSGSVYASVGFGEHFGASASIDTDGNYSLGVGAGTGKSGEPSFGGGIGISGNVSGGGMTFSAGVGYRDGSGMTIGMGVSVSDNGYSANASLGFSNRTSDNKGQSGAASLSTGSFSSGDWDIKSSGWYIPIQIYIFSIGFGKRKVTYSLKKGFNKKGYGILYANIDDLDANNDAIETVGGEDGQFVDYQNRYRYIDCYDQSLPVTEKEFVGDYDAEREKINFTFAGYDGYDVNASGISGSMTPRTLQNSTVFGLGYQGPDPKSTNQGKLKIYQHNSLSTNKSFGNNTSNDIEFYFKGQFLQNRNADVLSLINNNSGVKLQDFLSTRSALNNQRLRQANYIEVFTNKQIKDGFASDLLSPIDPNSNGVNLVPLNRNSQEYLNSGIGGYKITSPDGKVYHFSQPVYHFETVERNFIKQVGDENVSEKRQYSPYATHWLLTAITGPDFVDTNNNNIADNEDYGYWVRMDYGKWSDGYVWRNPADKNLLNYASNINEKIGTDDFGSFSFGRKQIYYLDRVVSASHTAYFVKDLRFDSAGKDLTYSFSPTTLLNDDGLGSGSILPHEPSISYKKQMQLVLKKILLVDNKKEKISKGNPSSPLLLNRFNLTDYNYKNYHPGYRVGGGFYNEYGDQNIVINNESGVYDVMDFQDFNYDNAIKVIDFQYDYNLAVKDHTNDYLNPAINKSKGAPDAVYNSIVNPNAGRLSLKKIKFLGRNNFEFMPAYEFQYKGEYTGPNSDYIKYPANAIVQKTSGGDKFNWQGVLIPSSIEEIPIADVRAKDEWGFYKDVKGQENKVNAAAWTLSKIVTPTGGSIEFEHEEDDFYVEAFARRYWTEGLMFNFNKYNDKIIIDVFKEPGNPSIADLDFSRYFRPNDNCWVDIWACATHDYHKGGCERRRATLDVNKKFIKVISATSTNLKLECSIGYLSESNGNPLFGRYITLNGGDGFILGSNIRNNCTNPPGCINVTDRLDFKYKLLANKVPTDENGGGLRVKSIVLRDEYNNTFKTRYYYNVPGTTRDAQSSGYKSSGITSYSPVRGQKFVPFQSELPSPGVMYEYVTMEAQDKYGRATGSTIYNFYTLKPVVDIFNPNVEMYDDDGTNIFKAQVIDYNSTLVATKVGERFNTDTFPYRIEDVYEYDYFFNANKKVKAKSIKVDVNTSVIGQFKSISEYNNVGQLLKKVERKYESGLVLKNKANLPTSNPDHTDRGSIVESFQNMKSVYTTNKDGGDLFLKHRLLSISTKEEYTSVLKSTTTKTSLGTSQEIYSNTDPYTGAFLTVETKVPNAPARRVERVPAYTKYPQMGSKVANSTNKNMLSQIAAEYVSILDNDGIWKVAGVGLTTWKNQWNYQDELGNSVTPTLDKEKIWRKHKSFTWNGSKDSQGIFANYNKATDGDFDWVLGVGAPTSKWKQLSEVTLYDRYSMMLETKDINNNFAASKMGDKETRITAVGNARYNEIFYSGMENETKTPNWLEPGIHVIETSPDYSRMAVSDVKAHTGTKSFSATSTSQLAIELKANQHRAGKYKLNVWVHKDNADNARISYCGGTQIFNGESRKAGDWYLKTHYLDIPAGDCTVKLVSANSTAVIYDDVMLRPIAASLSGYVYNNYGNLIAIIGNNGLAAVYKYDEAGRLTETYVEVLDDPQNQLTGGFKQKSKNTQTYKNL